MDAWLTGPGPTGHVLVDPFRSCFAGAAANHIRNGDADVMIAGGSEAPIIPVGLGGFVACRWGHWGTGWEAGVASFPSAAGPNIPCPVPLCCRALSQRNDEPQRASRPWDADRDGFVMGEGAGARYCCMLHNALPQEAQPCPCCRLLGLAGVLIMESLEHATKRGATILAEYLGGGWHGA